MFNRNAEMGLTELLTREGVGCIAFCPLAKGLLTNKYVNGIPKDSRAAHDPRYLKASDITDDKLSKVKKLMEIADSREQTLAQMALAWTLRDGSVTSALIGASKPEQITENIAAMKNTKFTSDELAEINHILNN